MQTLSICFALLGSSFAADPMTVSARFAPAVGGERFAVALQQIALAELKAETGVWYIAPDKWRDDLAEGVVHLQVPRAKAVVLSEDSMALWEFKKATAEQKLVEVPDLTGLTAAEAEKKLAEMELVATKSTDPAAKAPAGKVAEQYPKAKQTVYAKSAVFLRYR